MTRQLKFGVELEVATSKSAKQIREALEEYGIHAVLTSYGTPVNHTAWKIHRDGSLGTGWEIVSPPLTSTEELEKVTHVLRKVLKVRCTSKCGLHIHHDISDLTLKQIKNLYRLYSKYEMNAIQSIQSPSRYNNQYCKPISPILMNILNSETIEDFKYSVASRYYNLNNKAYIKYGTIEFRGAQGTVEIDRILSWLELTHKMIETAVSMTENKPLRSSSNEEALQEMIEELQISERTAKHYKKVQKFFSKIS